MDRAAWPSSKLEEGRPFYRDARHDHELVLHRDSIRGAIISRYARIKGHIYRAGVDPFHYLHYLCLSHDSLHPLLHSYDGACAIFKPTRRGT